MSVINTNITSMIGQSNLSKSQNALQTSMERLSSGLRINSAKDDAAGQAIANRMSSQITGLAQAQRNSNDGISVAQTAEGALNQVNDNLQRVRELTVQAQNGTNSQDDLKSIQAEIKQRMGEIDRISGQTDFNGVKVLASDQDLSIQVGANDNETIKIGLQKIDSSSLGLNNFTVSGDQAATLESMVDDFGASGYSTYNADIDGSAATDIQVDLQSGKVTTDGTTQLYVSQTTGTITANAANTAVTGSAEAATEFANAFSGLQNDGDKATVGDVEWTRVGAAGNTFGNGTYTAEVDGQTVEVTVDSSTDANGTNASISNIDGSLFMDETTFAAATTKFTAYGTNEDAREVDLKDAGGTYTGAALTGPDTQTYNVSAGGTVTYGNTGPSAADDGKVVYVKNAGEASQELISQDEAVEASRNPMDKLDSALSMVDTLRSDLGAIQNRFESAITNLQTNETNLSSARSRIEDADYATEVANMTKAQILQQAGTSVLAQANQIPQNVLSLLG